MSEYEYDFSAGIKQYKAIIDGGEADWVPVTAQMAEFCMKYGGLNGRKFFSDPEFFVRGNLDAQKKLGFDIPDLVWDVYSVEAEALGGDMAWFDDLYPALDNTRPIISNERELAAAKAPDPYKSGRMPWVLEALRICYELTGYTHYIHYCAPINVAAQVMQFEQLVLAMQERPKFVHKLMDFLVEEVPRPLHQRLLQVGAGRVHRQWQGCGGLAAVHHRGDPGGVLGALHPQAPGAVRRRRRHPMRQLVGGLLRPGLRHVLGHQAPGHPSVPQGPGPGLLPGRHEAHSRVRGQAGLRAQLRGRQSPAHAGAGGGDRQAHPRVHGGGQLRSVRQEVLSLPVQPERPDPHRERGHRPRCDQALPGRRPPLCRKGVQRPRRDRGGGRGRQGLHGNLRRGHRPHPVRERRRRGASRSSSGSTSR